MPAISAVRPDASRGSTCSTATPATRRIPIETGAFIDGEPSQWAIAGKNASGWTDLMFTSSDVRLVLSWNGTAYSN